LKNLEEFQQTYMCMLQ